MEFSDYLLSIRACEDARSWCGNKTLSEAWNTCERGDWLLWLAAKHMDKPGWPTRKQIVLAACACAETAQKFANDNGVSANTLKIVRLWANGEATIEQVREARRAAAAAAADADAYAYAYAYAAADADADAAAAYAAAYAAAADDADDAAAAARNKSRLETAQIVRSMLTIPASHE